MLENIKSVIAGETLVIQGDERSYRLEQKDIGSLKLSSGYIVAW